MHKNERHFANAKLMLTSVGTMALIIVGCHKGSAEPACGRVEEISRRDVNGVPILPPDTNDWKDMDDWCPAVEALFSDLPAVAHVNYAADSLLPVCFPNPTQDQFVLGFYRNDSSRVDVRFVDVDFQLLYRVDSIMSNSWLIDGDSIAPSDVRVVRAYYRVTHTDGTAHRGHGDIQLGL